LFKSSPLRRRTVLAQIAKCALLFCFALTGFAKSIVAEERALYVEHIDAGACDKAELLLTHLSQASRIGLRELGGYDGLFWRVHDVPRDHPELDLCWARAEVARGLALVVAQRVEPPFLQAEFPYVDNAGLSAAPPRMREAVEVLRAGFNSLVMLGQLYYGPALRDLAVIWSSNEIVPSNIEWAYEYALLAIRSDRSLDGALKQRLGQALDADVRANIEGNLETRIPDIAIARADAIKAHDDFHDEQNQWLHESRPVFEEALAAGDCERARALAVAETEDIDVSAYLDGPQDPWDQVSPKYDPALFQCRAEAALARGEVLAAGADLIAIADLLYDPALLTLAEIYSSGEHLPADPARAYRYLLLAEGFGASDDDLRLSLEGKLSETQRSNIDRDVSQGWPGLFRNLKETGKAGLFASPQPGLTLGD
jgi:TPR repeat protein